MLNSYMYELQELLVYRSGKFAFRFGKYEFLYRLTKKTGLTGGMQGEYR